MSEIPVPKLLFLLFSPNVKSGEVENKIGPVEPITPTRITNDHMSRAGNFMTVRCFARRCTSFPISSAPKAFS